MSTHKKKMLEKLCFFNVKIYDAVCTPNPESLIYSVGTINVCIIKYPYIYLYMYLWPVCTNVNNYFIFVPHVPIYWSERINIKVEVEGLSAEWHGAHTQT